MFSELSAPQPKVISYLLDLINCAIIIVDNRDRIVLANSRAIKMLQAEKKSLNLSPLTEIFMQEDRDVLVPNILKITRTQNEFEGEALLRKLDGSSFMGYLATASLPWQEGLGVIITIHDITTLKGIERILKKSERMAFLGQMLDDISHQIRNPVLAIGGFARRLAKMDLPRPEHLQVIMDESARLELVLDTLTEFIKLGKPKLESISLKSLIEDVESHLMELAKGLGANWISLIPSSLPDRNVLVDPRIFIRAVDAVVINACDAYDYMDADKTIEFWVELLDNDPWACSFCIRDKGSGIRPPILPYVFNPFFSTKTGHVGMGLTFARRIQEEQVGDIVVDSSLGEGTTVILYLSEDRRREIRMRKI